MKTRLLNLWEKLRSSFWLVPGGMTAAAAVLSSATVALDRRIGAGAFEGMPWLQQASADGVRSLLSTVATAMLTTAGVVFSVTIVAMTMASGQFGPRLLRNFIRARSTQIVLGALLATFLYCLLVLRFVRSGAGLESAAFIPHLSVLFSLAMTVGTLGLFIYFIHAIAVSLQADRVVAAVANELEANVVRFFPRIAGDSDGAEMENPGTGNRVSGEGAGIGMEIGDDGEPVASPRGGYVQAVDAEALLAVAVRCGGRVRAVCRPGHFVHAGLPLAWVLAPGLEDDDRDSIARCFLIGDERTPEQDIEFCIRQLVEIALRALSPGINDPFTAMTCIDHLGAAVGGMSRRREPKDLLVDEDGEARVSLWMVTFEDVLGCAFDQLRQAASMDVAVSLRLLEALGRLALQTRTPRQREAVVAQARLVAATSIAHAEADRDRSDLRERLAGVERACGCRDREAGGDAGSAGGRL